MPHARGGPFHEWSVARVRESRSQRSPPSLDPALPAAGHRAPVIPVPGWADGCETICDFVPGAGCLGSRRITANLWWRSLNLWCPSYLLMVFVQVWITPELSKVLRELIYCSDSVLMPWRLQYRWRESIITLCMCFFLKLSLTLSSDSLSSKTPRPSFLHR